MLSFFIGVWVGFLIGYIIAALMSAGKLTDIVMRHQIERMKEQNKKNDDRKKRTILS